MHYRFIQIVLLALLWYDISMENTSAIKNNCSAIKHTKKSIWRILPPYQFFTKKLLVLLGVM